MSDNKYLGGIIVPLNEFKDAVTGGMFTDHDGFGYFFKDGEVIKDKKIYPSDLYLLDTKNFTHILWYNK
jgi:hypothetical protein